MARRLLFSAGMKLAPRLFGVVATLATTWVVQGCGSVQVVQETPRGGVVELRGATTKARAKAEDHMRAQCPFGYRIVDEQDARIAYACKDATPNSSPTPAAQTREVGVDI